MKARKVKGVDPVAPLQASAAQIVRVRLEELRGLGEQALVPEASTAQHDARIAAKRLRYVLELFERCIGEEATVARLAAKRLQSALGDLHDCDVMLPKAQGVDSLQVALRARRQHHFHEFVELWQREASSGTWAALEAAL